MSTISKSKDAGVAESVLEYGAETPAGRSGQHPYLALLGLRSFDTAGLVKRLEAGVSFAAFERLKRKLKVSSLDLAEMAQITPRTLARRKKAGRLQPDESDRLVRLARVFSGAIGLFDGDADAAQEWMMRPNRGLGGASPFEMVRTEVGAREVERLIGRIEHGVFS
jgi:putative toxin-antitoxin system antitoxin component (TIGR02293 family)